MARSVEIFRDNGIKVSQMNEEEAARIARNQAERAAMMAELPQPSAMWSMRPWPAISAAGSKPIFPMPNSISWGKA